MNGKKLIRKMGSLVVIATLIASAFVVLQNGKGVANGSSVHDVGISTDYQGAVNGIKITRDGTDVIGANESLIIGETYKIRYKLVNNGDFNESINVKVTVGNTTIATHNYSVSAGATNTYADEWNTTGLSPGDYTIIVNASIENDSNPSDNIATRNVVLEMPNLPPIANFTYEPENPTTADTVYFNSTSTDPDGTIESWEWNLGDGNTASGEKVTHKYADDGTYSVTLVVTDDDGATANITKSIIISKIINLTLIYPVGGEIIGGIIPIEWNASSSIGSELKIKLEYKNETGEWKLIADNLANNGIYHWDATGLEKEKKYKIRVIAKDTQGNNASKESNLFTITKLEVSPKTAYYNDVKNVYVNNTEGMVTLYRSDGSVYDSQNGAPGDVIFFNVKFDMVGSWYINDSVRGIFYIYVKPIKLNVSVSPSEVDFAKSGTASYVDIDGYVKDKEGNPVKNATIEIWAPGAKAGEGSPIKNAKTNETGYYTISSLRIASYGAGKYNVTARIGNFSNPNAFGYTLFSVNPVTANITLKNNTAIGGFNIGKVIFEITDSSGSEILYHNYNISVYKDGKLYAWKNNTGTSNETKMQFNATGKTLTITSNMWEAGGYTLKVKADIIGSNNWEYTGEEDFTISSPPPVTVDVLSPVTQKMDVLDLNSNSQNITIQIFGENMTTYGNKTNLKIGPNNENVTERIKVEGDVLYSPPAKAYHYLGNGKWNITVFPRYGNGKIYINVSWPDKGEASKVITVDKGGKATVEPTEMIVDTPTNITITLKTREGNPVTYVDELRLYYEIPPYYNNTNWQLIVNKSDYNAQGIFNFNNISSEYAGVNLVVMAKFKAPDIQYAYAAIKSQAAHDLNIALSPPNVLIGEKTKFKVNITRNGKPYDDPSGFDFYILNESQLQKLHDGKLDLSILPKVSHSKVNTGNYTFDKIMMEDGKYYLYVKSKNSKHDNLNNEPSFNASKASVTTSPTALVKDVDKNITMTFYVKWKGQPLNGTLKIKGIKEVASFEAFVKDAIYNLSIENGEAKIENLSAIALGNITFEFKPEGIGNVFAPADGLLKVEPPNIAVVEPKEKVAFLGVENLIVIRVTHPVTGNGCGGLNVQVRVPGSNQLIDVGKTKADGKLLFGVIPLETGQIEIYVENAIAGKINVSIGLKINAPTEITKDKQMKIIITTKGGSVVEGATVKVDGNIVGTTDSNGIVKYKPTKTGTITITAEKEGYYTASMSVEVKKAPSGIPGFEFIGLAIGLLAALLLVRRKRK